MNGFNDWKVFSHRQIAKLADVATYKVGLRVSPGTKPKLSEK